MTRLHMTRVQMIVVAVCLAFGVGGYLLSGRPGMDDMPMVLAIQGVSGDSWGDG